MTTSKRLPKEVILFPREDIHRVLCALNDNLGSIRNVTLSQGNEQHRRSALNLLGNVLGEGFLRNKIRAILSDVWHYYRNPESSELPNQLYRYGAFPRTLPKLDEDYPGLLAEVGCIVKERQKERLFRENGVVCRCGYTQDMACIRCDKCDTWQHILCYYDTEDEPKEFETHLCDGCNCNSLVTVDESTLLSALSELKIEVQDIGSGSLDSEECVLGPFGFPGDENYFWGPEEPEIQRVMDMVLANVRRVVYSLMAIGIDRRRTVPAILNDSESGLKTILGGVLGPSYLTKLQEILTSEERDTRSLGSMFTGLIMVLVCCKISTSAGREEIPHCTEALLLNALCDNILSKNGPEVLRDLIRTTLFSLTEGRNSALESLVAVEAEEHAKVLTSTLVAMVHPRSLRAQQEAPKWTKIFRQVFSIGLRLKTRLLLADRLYEFHFPKAGSNSSPSLMTDESRDKVPEERVVGLCLVPAIIEYEPQSVGRTANVGHRLISRGVFISASEEQRSKGNVVSPAVVCLQN